MASMQARVLVGTMFVATGNLTILTHASAHQILSECVSVSAPPTTAPEATKGTTAAQKPQNKRKRRAVGAIIRLVCPSQ